MSIKSVLCITLTQERYYILKKTKKLFNNSGWNICLYACCQYLCQHIFDHHSSIFSADVALDKLRMTSSQKFWQRTKLPQGHWLLTDSSLLCKFVCPLSSYPGPATNSDMEQITLSYHSDCCLLLFCLWPWGPGSCVWAAWALKSLYYPSSTRYKLNSSCLSEMKYDLLTVFNAIIYVLQWDAPTCTSDLMNKFFFFNFPH